jgi:hypothetical protein
MPFVYFILDEVCQLVKIGSAFDVRVRMSALIGANPHPLTLLGAVECGSHDELEASIHQRLSASRRHCEWFAFDDATKALMAEYALSLPPNKVKRQRCLICRTGARVNRGLYCVNCRPSAESSTTHDAAPDGRVATGSTHSIFGAI